jgi:TorA maturation chaperone TorD
MGAGIGMSRAEEASERASIYELMALRFSLPSPELAKAVSGLIPEYHRLFVGPGELPAPPYESVYREGWRVMGETTLDVQSAYEEAGYALDSSFKELPDHVAAELVFMALLAEEEAKAWETGDASAAVSWLERQRAFLDDHLTRWLPAFCDRLLASTEVSFYRKLAGELQEFVALDAERLKSMAGLLAEALA